MRVTKVFAGPFANTVRNSFFRAMLQEIEGRSAGSSRAAAFSHGYAHMQKECLSPDALDLETTSRCQSVDGSRLYETHQRATVNMFRFAPPTPSQEEILAKPTSESIRRPVVSAVLRKPWTYSGADEDPHKRHNTLHCDIVHCSALD